MKLRRKELRNNCTAEEVVLWNLIRDKKIGFKFFRQYSIGNYIIDFYCPAKRLAIELDGNQHNDETTKQYDSYRTEYFKAFGIRVIRFWNQEVVIGIEVVVEKIKKKLGILRPLSQ